MEKGNRKIKRAEDSMVEQVHLIRHSHLNGAGRLFGGTLMQWIDEVAGITAKRHSEGNVTTAAIDNLQFLKGAYANDIIVLISRLTYVGNTSMEVRVDVYAESDDGMRRPINRAYLVMVALDEKGKSKTVPGLEICSAEQRAEWEGGEKRKAMRLKRRMEGF